MPMYSIVYYIYRNISNIHLYVVNVPLHTAHFAQNKHEIAPFRISLVACPAPLPVDSRGKNNENLSEMSNGKKYDQICMGKGIQVLIHIFLMSIIITT